MGAGRAVLELISHDECEYARRNVARIAEETGEGWEKRLGALSFSRDGLGDVEIVDGTGRARCRQCGERIRKGERAIKGYYDFNGCGSWTAVTVQIHLHDCNGKGA